MKKTFSVQLLVPPNPKKPPSKATRSPSSFSCESASDHKVPQLSFLFFFALYISIWVLRQICGTLRIIGNFSSNESCRSSGNAQGYAHICNAHKTDEKGHWGATQYNFPIVLPFLEKQILCKPTLISLLLLLDILMIHLLVKTF